MKINWKQKLSSRKFWAAVIGVATSLMMVFGFSDLTQEQVTGVITAVATLIAYILGEGMVDSARLKAADSNEEKPGDEV